MKRVLITGANSYVGTNVEKWLMREPEKFYVETLDMKNPNWRDFDFSKFDVVFHVAGIVHVSAKKNLRALYYKVNRDLTIETAQIAKSSGVRHFVFMSTMSVFGKHKGIINSSSIAKPSSHYGQSKHMAEQILISMADDNFGISILRPPLIYGFNCPGNYTKISKLTKLLIIFPKFYNCRSMIFIDNFSEFFRLVISNNMYGIFHPQNSEYVSTLELVQHISKVNNKSILTISFLNPLIYLLRRIIPIFSKLFGDLTYDFDMSTIEIDYNVVSFTESILISEGLVKHQ